MSKKFSPWGSSLELNLKIQFSFAASFALSLSRAHSVLASIGFFTTLPWSLVKNGVAFGGGDNHIQDKFFITPNNANKF